jgi:hypothetical protein
MVSLKAHTVSFVLLILTSIVRNASCFSNFKTWSRAISRIYQSSSSTVSAFSSATQHHQLSRVEAQSSLDDKLMPKKYYGNRIGLGRDAQGIDGGTALKPDDPRLSMTYAEFPLSSFDILVDLGLKYLPSSQDRPGITTFVDIGSGCGRLILYLAMSRFSPSDDAGWNIHGIEISNLLHGEAIQYLEEAVKQNIFSFEEGGSNSLSLHLGAAEDSSHLFGRADCIFAYSTAFSAKSFSPELGALLLDPEWSSLLSESCKPGCVAITTDRALDPACGWELVDRLDVENQEVFGSTGYIHILRQ